MPSISVYIDNSVLSSVLDGSYEKVLSEVELMAIDSVPHETRQWFDRAVVNDFYLQLREVMRRVPQKPGSESGLDFLNAMVDVVNGAPTQYKHISLKKTYNARQSSKGRYNHRSASVTFEEVIESALREYKGRVMTSIQVAVDSKSNIRYFSISGMLESLIKAI